MQKQEMRRKSMTKIWIDAGHGGKDSGAVGNGLVEKDWVLTVAKQIQNELMKAGFEVGMTRTNDTFYELSDRAKKANSFKADLFISIHFNAGGEKVMKTIFIRLLPRKQLKYKKLSTKMLSLKLLNME